MEDCDRLVEELRRVEGERRLLLHEALRLLECFGLPVARFRLVSSPEEAAKAAEELGGRVALKIVSPDVVHKTDVGGVILGVEGGEEAAKAYHMLVERVRERAPGARITGVLVQEMAPKGLEMIVGGIRDAVFGPVVALGLGGVFVEVYGDIAFRPTPLVDIDVDDMVSELRASRLLHGYRGMPPRDLEALRSVVLKVARLMEELPVKELDINPLILYARGEGAKIVDARIVLSAR